MVCPLHVDKPQWPLDVLCLPDKRDKTVCLRFPDKEMKSEIVLIKSKQAQHILSGKGFPLLESGFP